MQDNLISEKERLKKVNNLILSKARLSVEMKVLNQPNEDGEFDQEQNQVVAKRAMAIEIGNYHVNNLPIENLGIKEAHTEYRMTYFAMSIADFNSCVKAVICNMSPEQIKEILK